MGLAPGSEEAGGLPLLRSATSGCQPGSGSSPDVGSAGTVVLGIPASRTVRRECVLFEPPSLWSFVAERRRPSEWTVALNVTLLQMRH